MNKYITLMMQIAIVLFVVFSLFGLIEHNRLIINIGIYCYTIAFVLFCIRITLIHK